LNKSNKEDSKGKLRTQELIIVCRFTKESLIYLHSTAKLGTLLKIALQQGIRSVVNPKVF
jgi:hypothetical protein